MCWGNGKSWISRQSRDLSHAPLDNHSRQPRIATIRRMTRRSQHKVLRTSRQVTLQELPHPRAMTGADMSHVRLTRSQDSPAHHSLAYCRLMLFTPGSECYCPFLGASFRSELIEDTKPAIGSTLARTFSIDTVIYPM
ncbi:hypothetical protein FS749_008882 [Ceratobasidium sp. UAMH 11750]|nr:hypothetical protein FS749_008882 [Ceratobasidium sp. UAMH 11750]